MEKDLDIEIIENDPAVETAYKKNTRASCWVGTWNNPKMSDDEFVAHLQKLADEGYLQYATFQREQGENETPHFQFFVNWKNSRYFKWIKEHGLPKGCHFKPMYVKSTKTKCKNYCQKPDGRLSPQFYEVGDFVEERARTDLAKMIERITNGETYEEVASDYPTQALMYERQLRSLEQRMLKEKYGNSYRDVKVTFIYGATRLGKTWYLNEKYELKDVCRVTNYKTGTFESYTNQPVLLLDEFTGKLDITFVNNLLDRYPIDLPARFNNRTACFTKVYIISNLTLAELYKDEQHTMPEVYKAFVERFHDIIKFTAYRTFHFEMENKMIALTSEQEEDLPF